MGDVNPQESERIPLKPREIAQAITRGNSLYVRDPAGKLLPHSICHVICPLSDQTAGIAVMQSEYT